MHELIESIYEQSTTFTMEAQKLKILLLEDNETDANLIQRVLQRAGMDFDAIVANDEQSFLDAVENNVFDIILSDNYLPQFDATAAIQHIREKKIDTPLILVTGTVSEGFAISMIKTGACDYILKDRLQRLPHAIQNAIERHILKTKQKKELDDLVSSEALLKETEKLAHFGSWELDLKARRANWSDGTYRILGYEPGEVTASLENFLDRIHPEDLQSVKNTINDAISNGVDQKFNCRIIKKSGEVRQLESSIFNIKNDRNETMRVNIFSIDVTSRK